MENNHSTGEQFGKSTLGKCFLGGLPLLGGVLTILLSLDILPYMDSRPNRIAIFNDPHTWQAFSVGVLLTTFGFAFLIPPRMGWLGKLNTFILLAAFAAVVIGVILQKTR